MKISPSLFVARFARVWDARRAFLVRLIKFRNISFSYFAIFLSFKLIPDPTAVLVELSSSTPSLSLSYCCVGVLFVLPSYLLHTGGPPLSFSRCSTTTIFCVIFYCLSIRPSTPPPPSPMPPPPPSREDGALLINKY